VTGVRKQEYRAISLREQDLNKGLEPADIRTEPGQRAPSVTFFGGFGLGNFGNEITLQTILFRLRHLAPDVELTCICTDPEATAKLHNISTVAINRAVLKAWTPENRWMKVLRSVFIGIPSELYRWFEGFMILSRTDILIVPGTGLLTDAYGLKSWGPYSLFKWSLIAKMRGCKLLFCSVGAGPIYSHAGRWLVRAALALADYRSYRDAATKTYLRSIGAAAANDKVYPDLAFSVVDQITPRRAIRRDHRSVVGLGLMLYHGKLSGDVRHESTYMAYLQELVVFVKWLLAHDYDIRLLIGELTDNPVVAEFRALLKDHLDSYDEDRIIDEPVRSAEDLLAQIGETDAVVATRFHNVLLALALNKPVISISFHQKCTSLMQSMGLQEYCQDIQQLNAERLIDQFCQLEKSAGSVQDMIREKVADCRNALDEQYSLIFNDVLFG